MMSVVSHGFYLFFSFVPAVNENNSMCIDMRVKTFDINKHVFVF